MLQRRQYNKAFSIVEMLIAVALVTCLSAVSYRILKSATQSQLSSVESQKANSLSQVALDRFKSDVSQIDYNWVRFGIAVVYPHQGYEFGSNYYTDETISQTEMLNDGVTFLRRDSSKDRIYELNTQKRVCYPEAQSATLDMDLYNKSIKLMSVEGLVKDDWAMVYQAGHYALGVITGVNTGTKTVVLRMPNDVEKQLTAQNGAGKSNGYVVQPGVVMASMDFDGTATTDTADDMYCFDSETTRLQKMASPVSYFVDYRTNNGEEKSLTNTYVLNDRGEKEKMLVRAEFVKGEVSREYIAKIDGVGFTYDLLGEQTVSGVVGEIVRNVGRDKNSDELLDLSHSADETDQFQSTYRIVALKINVTVSSQDQKSGGEGWKQTKELKVALDPSFSDEAYKDTTTVVSSLTDTLTTLASTGSLTEELGRPLYLVHGDSEEIMVPVSKFQVNLDGSMGSQSTGEIYIYDKNGCSVNATSGCSPSENNSVIRFNAGSNIQFFPNTMVETQLSNGAHRVVVGGVGMMNDGSVVTRKSILATIDLMAGESLTEKLQNPISGPCNITGCSLQTIDTTVPELSNLVDTAHVSIDSKNPGNIYVTTVTKKTGENSPAVLYKGELSGSSYNFTKYGSVPGTDQSRVVSSIADRLITVNGDKYIVACTTKKISSSCESGQCLTSTNGAIPSHEVLVSGLSGFGVVTSASIDRDTTGGESSTSGGGSASGGDGSAPIDEDDNYGSIMLLSQGSLGSDTLDSVILEKHNYRCSSLNVDENNNLIVFGRLTAQPISHLDIQRAVLDPLFQEQMAQKVMYLDEVINTEADGSAYFADYYQVDPTTYADSENPQYIGWLTGASTVEFPDGTFGMVNGNKYRLDAGYAGNTSASAKEFSNAGILQISLAGMQDRVVASIETDPKNFNNSVITTTYALQSTELPSVYIPGSFYVNDQAQRTEPTPLPAISPGMSDESWLLMYQKLLSSSNGDLNTDMPTLGNSTVKVDNCESSFPNTCK